MANLTNKISISPVLANTENTTNATKHCVGTAASKLNWEMILKDWQQSGKTQKLYCQEHDIKLHIFSYYHNKYSSTIDTTNRLAPIRLAASADSLSNNRYQLKLSSGAVLSIPDDYAPNTLKPLLVLLGVCK